LAQIVESSQTSTPPRDLFGLILRHLDEGVLVLDAEGRRVYANEQAARLTGYDSPAELVAAPPEEAASRFEIRDRDGNPVGRESFVGGRALAGEDEVEPVLLRFSRAGGPEHVAEVRGSAVRDESGAVAYAITFFRDVTERVVEADEAHALYRDAQQTTALLDALYGSAPVGLGFWDRDLRYVRVNQALADINERPPEDHIGRTLREVVPQIADDLEPLARGVLESGVPVIGREMASGTPGDPDALRFWRASYYPVLGADGRPIGVGAVVEETTARRLAERRTELQHGVSRVLAETDAVDEAIRGVLRTICETLAWDVACYWAADPDAPRLTWGQPGIRAEGFLALTERAMLTPAMLPGRVAATSEVEWVEDIDESALPARAPVALAEGLSSGVAFPLLVEGAPAGVVELFSQRRRPADPDVVVSLEALGAQLGQFLRRKRAEEERGLLLQRERAARAEAEAAATTLRKLERVAEAALEHVSLQSLLDTLLLRIVEVLEANTAAILLVGDDDKLHVRATVGLEAAMEHAVAIPLGAGMAGQVAASRTALLVPDLSKIELVSPVLRERGINSIVAIPLVAEDRVIGVVHAGSEAYAQFVEEDARLLELIADRIALAINQAALYEAEQEAQERLQFLGEASALLASSLEVDETLQQVARLAVPQFADWCAVDLARHDGILQRVAVAQAGQSSGDVVASIPSSDESVWIGAAFKSGVGTVKNDDTFATMVLPLVVRSRMLGALTFVWAESGKRYSAADFSFAQELAARAAVAVDNARLYRDAQHRRDRLAFLAEASALLGSSLDVDATLERLAQLLADRFGDWCSIHLVGPHGTVRAATVASRDPEKTELARAELAQFPPDRPAPDGVREAIATRRTQEWDVVAHAAGSLEVEEGVHSGIVVPLLTRDRVLGALTVVRSTTPEPFDRDDVEFVEDVARRAAVAIDNAQLYQEVATRRDRLDFLAEASALLGSSLDVELTLEQLGGLVAGRIAAWCTIHLVTEGGPPRLVTVAGLDEPASRLPVAEVVRTGEQVQGDGFLVAPLKARGRTFGALGLAWPGGGPDDVEFAVDLARRAAIAIDNAQLYSAAAERAQAARVLASVGDGVFLVDRTGYVRTWNRAAAIATSLPASAVVDKLAVEAIPGWAAIQSRVTVATAGSTAPRPESLPLDLGSREVWLSIHGVAVPDGIVYAFRDLTEERALEQMRTEFVSTVSHELRTPLAAIYGAAMTLRRSDVALDEDQRARLLDVVSGEADRLARTVNDILWASRLDTDSLHVTIQSCDPLALLGEVVQAQEAHLDRGHAIVVDAAPDLPQIAGDPDKVGRVLINLVDNGVKYSPDGGRIAVAVQPVGSHVRFSVTDEGLGIPLAEQRRVFEKFYRLDPNMNRGVGGTGLGLYICRELVRRMDGRIWVESAGLGRGSTFHVELPVARF
jgi:PAS domain S-box-containing protein